MFYTIGYVFAGILVLAVACLAIGYVSDSIRETRLNKQYLPDIDKNANIKISIDGGDQKYYRVDDLVTCLNDEGRTKNQRFVKILELHELTEAEISDELLK
ncbi:hypothetical protein [Levilactobacillus brevis]|uniref:hypothetical protein n=1 Tax=Levilactobacillus brevis TaxID=1580 RepID=UPI000847E31F|nr:hypothetical protein [Levilactobacillus brevis]ARN89799.1 hypothetical protein AZI09_04385 [Levilactobacillus brevis]ARN97383.1 hypothetical protein AZI10_04365 [Levilactobacillus brevis]ODP93287.1 hypothetical protein BGC39_02270 [Levilactobacillus brevis]